MIGIFLRNLNFRISLTYLTVLATLSVFFLYFAQFDTTQIGGRIFLHVADDHMITMRVAKNFADYGVPFFNHDEAVAANTSLFWPLILGATIMTFSITEAVALNILMSVFLSAMTIAIATLWFKEWWLRLSAIILLAGSATYLKFGASGWEHIPQAFFVTLGFYFIYKSSVDKLIIPTFAVFLISFSFIFRPDSAVIIAFTVLAWVLHNDNYKRWKIYPYSLLLLVLPISYLILMNHYYDSFLPNTSKLKILDLQQSLEFGIMYVINPIKSGLAPLLLLILFFIKSKGHFSRLVLFIGCMHFSYVVLIGGDVFSFGRFFILLLPTLVFVTLYEIDKLYLSNKEFLKTSLLSVIVLVTIAGNYEFILTDTLLANRDSNEVEQIRVVRNVSERLEPSDGSIGMHYLGISYHIPEFHVVDFLGKAEPNIASMQPKYGGIGHNKWDYQYAFERYNIAVVPMQDRTVLEVSSPQFKLTQRNLSFSQECVQFIQNSDAYVYLPSEYFGNSVYGAFVRRDLSEKFQ